MIRPLLILLEGANDLDFLVRIARRLQNDLRDAPDLAQLQAAGRILLLPLGGGNAASWPDRFRALGLNEFHLYDKEQQPETGVRLRAVALVNARAGCHAALTSKRCLENYLHPQAVAAAGGGKLAFGDDDSVSMLLARHRFEQTSPSLLWDGLARRSQRRLSAHAKRWLNRVAVEQMTAELLAERDSEGELLGRLQNIQELVPGAG